MKEVKPYYQDDHVTLYHGDCLDMLATLPDASVDSVVTDPPYGLEFMGKEWDAPWKASGVGRGVRVATERADEMTPTGGGHTTSAGPYLAARVDSVRVAGLPFQQWCELWARECLRVLKPGGYLLAFGGTRTWHRLAVAIEDAGFELRDSIAWLYGSGFPKSLDVSKAIDKAAGAEREVIGRDPNWRARVHSDSTYDGGQTRPEFVTTPATPDAERWQGWGTALKPGFEPVVVARKPLEGTVAANVLAWGTGALNIDGCRVEGEFTSGWSKSGSKASENDSMSGPNYARDPKPDNPAGRWPANVVLDGPMAAALDRQSGTLASGVLAAHHQRAPKASGILGAYGSAEGERGYGDTGGASRFFYVAKAPTSERPRVGGIAHPTVKPLDLMRWLVRLVTPPGGTVLEPFAGSGTTAEACVLEGFQCIAIEREADYLPLIVSRLDKPVQLGLNFGDPV